jgi:tRNA pseudouridine38-40 synthase
MVRNITGSLAMVGEGERPPGWIKDVLESRDRKQGGIAAPPHGLTLVAVDYPESYGIPPSRDTD